jgi:hypothetical protein
MPKRCCARAPADGAEERRGGRLARSRRAPRDCLVRAGMIVMRGDGRRTADIAAALAGHPQPVRARLARCNAAGFAGWRDRPRAGRARWLTEAERSPLRGLVALAPPGRLVRGRLSPFLRRRHSFGYRS